MAEEKSSEDYGAEGGRKRAENRTKAELSEIGRKGASARWHKGLPKATHEGTIRIGDLDIDCAVLEDGRRVLTQSGFMRALGRARQAKGRTHYDADVNMPAFLTAKNLKPFISNELAVTSSQIEFQRLGGGRAFGYAADLLPKVCDVFLDAKAAGVLAHNQQHVADMALILVRGLARVGIAALVDEATGFQADRARDAMARILEAYVQKELRKWVSTFPPSFYEQLCRLRGVEFPPEKMRLPPYFGTLTNNIVYARLAPGVKDELKRVEAERRAEGKGRGRLHQHLTSGVGVPKLAEHLAAATAVMRISPDYEAFEGNLDKALPKWDETLPLALND